MNYIIHNVRNNKQLLIYILKFVHIPLNETGKLYIKFNIYTNIGDGFLWN